MASWAERIVELLTKSSGLTDREITDRLVGRGAAQQTVNQVCRRLESEGRLTRRSRHDGLLGNYVTSSQRSPSISAGGSIALGLATASNPRRLSASETRVKDSGGDGWLSEDEVKRHVKSWLESEGWRVSVAWGRAPGLDICADKDGQRWLMEAKGGGSLPAMRVNYFLSMLGELLQRMDDPGAKYSIVVPDLQQFRGLWTRLPSLAKSRLGLTVVFVGSNGEVVEYPK